MKLAELVSQITRQVTEHGPFVLDGGLGSELERRGYDISSVLWSADLIINNPAALKEVHLAYLEAGARCITSASYQASVDGLQRQGYKLPQVREILWKSVELARESVDEYLSGHPNLSYRPLVAASIGPFGAAQADGSEYRGDYGLGAQELAEFHWQRLLWMDQSRADILAVETIPDLMEADVLAKLLTAVKTPAWVSFCCADGRHLRDGNLLRDAAAAFADVPGVFALGINCTAPGYINELLDELRDVAGEKLLLVYPNSGADYDARVKRWSGHETADEFCALARQWQNHGAQMIGGCCQIGPEQIAALTEENQTW